MKFKNTHIFCYNASPGSLETGKPADLIVLDRNPIEDIRDSETISYVMKNDRIYEGIRMDETGNTPKKRGYFYWE